MNSLIGPMLCQYSPASFLPVLPHLHCFLFFKLNIQSPTWAENCQALHQNGLGPFEKDVKLIVGQSVGELWRRDPVMCVPLCLLYLTAELRRSVVSTGGPWDCAAPPTNVCRCNLVHSRQTHAVTFWLCSSIVVAIFVTFWNDSLLRIKTLIKYAFFSPPAGCDWRFYHRVMIGRFNPGAKAPPVWSVMLKSVLCSLKTATTFTGLFITAKLFAAIFKCRATQSPTLVCHVICCDYRAECALTSACVWCLLTRGPNWSWMIARVERGRAGHRREKRISVVDPSGCSSCALVLFTGS